MQINNFFDITFIALANAFFMFPLYTYEICKQSKYFSNDFYLSYKYNNYYFLLAHLVCSTCLTVVYCFIPYGKIVLLTIAACGFSSIIMELNLLLKYLRMKEVNPQVEEPERKVKPHIEEPERQVRQHVEEPEPQVIQCIKESEITVTPIKEPYQEVIISKPQNIDPYKIFY